ncbi:MAG: HDOD domain-containing protein [Thermodesulfobacteriota bacterium]|nr:HDOD domain-containing protein [Thermodesulfobacteriota bacterium]
MPTQTQSQKSIWHIVNALVQEIKQGELELPVMPRVVEDTQRALADPDMTLDKIARIVEQDTVVSARLIAVANTPYYARQKKAKTVKDAILRLGEKETKHIVIAVANRSLFRTRNPRFKTFMEDLWRHSLATANAAVLIAEYLDFQNSEKLFFMGLLHDIGKIIILQKLSGLLDDAHAVDTAELNHSLYDAHQSIGGVILRKWRFGKDFIQVATLHEGPKFYPPINKSLLIVNLANALTHKIGYSLVPDEGPPLAELDSARKLHISSETLDVITEKIKTLMSSVEIN